ncbi:hypothetical protein NDU88_001433 [Pleurodeles waltl]|uniref:Uncharacterized protein n=1 Tax=Pleurodeles waltl TaxID=8319 RepID=A0AAV7R932_PLEWA|nr:hypothetical protein NDU88_001433 [Pleurodeles waltl]
MHSFLQETLHKLTGIAFDPSVEFQRAHRLGPKRPGSTVRPRPIIACLLRHTQARQLLQRAHSHGPYEMDDQEIRITADFSKETSERRRAFLALRPRLHQMEVKYMACSNRRECGLRKTVCPKTSTIRRTYDLSWMARYLWTHLPRDSPATDQNTLPQGPAPGGSGSDRHPTVSHPRGRDLERLMNSHDYRRQVLHAVALHTQVADKDKSHSPLKPPADTL